MMNRIIVRLALAACFAAPLAPAQAWLAQKTGSPPGTPTRQILLARSAFVTSGAADRYYPLAHVYTGLTTPQKATVFSAAGAVSSMRFRAEIAPTGVQSWTATLYKNGASTGQTCTVNSSSSPAGVCTSSTSVSFAAGDYGDFLVHPSGSPANTYVSASFVFAPTTPNDTILTGVVSGLSNSVDNAAPPFNTSVAAVPSLRRLSQVADGGTLDKLYIITTAAGGAASGMKYDFSAGVNGAATAVTCAALETATSCSDLTHSVAIVNADDTELITTPTNTPASATASFGYRYVPTTAGSFPILSTGASAADNATVATYYSVSSGSGAQSGTETNVQNISDSMTVTSFNAKLQSSPGGGKFKDMTFRVNGSDTSATCRISDVATTCSWTGSVTVNANDLISISDVPSAGSPASSGVSFAISAHQ